MKRRLTLIAVMLVTISLVTPRGASLARPDVRGGLAPAAPTANVRYAYAAGDIACDPIDPDADPSWNNNLGTADSCRALYTSDIIRNDPFFDAVNDRVFMLGDGQYTAGELSDWNASYDKTWGANPIAPRTSFKAITRPAVGNHEYLDVSTPGPAQGYRDYWGGMANWNTQCTNCGYYSYDFGNYWHVLVLNTNCDEDPLTVETDCSDEGLWVASDLAASTRTCEVAYGHHARWSTFATLNKIAPLFDALYDGGADLYLAGHLHYYERYAPLNKSGLVDSTSGVRQVIIGSGGADHQALGSHSPPTAPQYQNNTDYGVLRLNLNQTSYTLNWFGENGVLLDGSITKACH